MELNNKTALVLGSIKGIGKGIALALAEQGANVALPYFDWEESLDTIKKEFSKFKNRHLILKTNLLNTDTIYSLVEKVNNHFGSLDIVINNIERGGWPVVHGPYVESQWDLEFATTLRAKKWIFDASIPYLKSSGNGIVINISSIAGMVGRSGPASYIFNEGYAAANRGISILTETWARIGAPEVRVNEIMLGIFETRHGEKTRGWDMLTNNQKQSVMDHTLLRRTGKIDDIVKTVLFVINDAPFMTGSVIKLDGGYTLGGENVTPMPKGVL